MTLEKSTPSGTARGTVPALPAPHKKGSRSKMLTERALETLTPEVLEKVTALATTGTMEAAIRKTLGIPRAEWRQRKKEDPALQAALDEGRQLDLNECSSLLRRIAFNPKHEKQITALLAYLKPVPGLRDHGAQPAPADTGARITIVLPRPMTESEYRRHMAIETTFEEVPSNDDQ